MHSELAYSNFMKILLMVVAVVYSFFTLYFLATLVLKVHGQKAGPKRKVRFAFITGVVIYPTFIFIISAYFKERISTTAFDFLTSPNPLLSLTFCVLGIKALKLLPVRSVQTMGIGFHYYMLIFWFSRFINRIILPQPPGPFNYLVEILCVLLDLALFYVLYRLTRRFLRRNPKLIVSYKLNVYVNRNREYLAYVIESCLVYGTVLFFCATIKDDVLHSFTISLFLLMYLALRLLYNNYQSIRAEVINKELHIDSLLKASEGFRAIKHDFYNILQTYSGYFALENYEDCKKYHNSLVLNTVSAGDSLDLNYRLPENPSLMALLIEKHRRAQHMDIHMEISLRCSLSDLPIDEIDISRIMACLLDNAIEAAAEAPPHHLSFIVEQKAPNIRLIIITNSTDKPMSHTQMFAFGKTSKPGHQGIGLNTVMRTIDKYGNCTFQIDNFNQQVVTYLELRDV